MHEFHTNGLSRVYVHEDESIIFYHDCIQFINIHPEGEFDKTRINAYDDYMRGCYP